MCRDNPKPPPSYSETFTFSKQQKTFKILNPTQVKGNGQNFGNYVAGMNFAHLGTKNKTKKIKLEIYLPYCHSHSNWLPTCNEETRLEVNSWAGITAAAVRQLLYPTVAALQLFFLAFLQIPDEHTT